LSCGARPLRHIRRRTNINLRPVEFASFHRITSFRNTDNSHRKFTGLGSYSMTSSVIEGSKIAAVRPNIGADARVIDAANGDRISRPPSKRFGPAAWLRTRLDYLLITGPLGRCVVLCGCAGAVLPAWRRQRYWITPKAPTAKPSASSRNAIPSRVGATHLLTDNSELAAAHRYHIIHNDLFWLMTAARSLVAARETIT
jgi:hypothetical protein